VGEYKGWTRLSPPAAYPYNTVVLKANKGNLRPKHHVYAVDYYSSVAQGYPFFIRGLYYSIRHENG
jgi:hypothetical protein